MEQLQAAARDISWSSISTDTLRAELFRRAAADNSDAADNSNLNPPKPACGSGKRGHYDTGLHVGALALILFLSTVACGFPLLSKKTAGRGMRSMNNVIFLCQHFGTGVLLATAFVHLLPTAFVSLTNPCLPDFFNKGYNPLAGLIAMIFALAVVGLESYLTSRGAGHSHSHGIWDEDDEDGEGPDVHVHAAAGDAHGGYQPPADIASRRGMHSRPRNIELDDISATQGLMAGASPLPESTPTSQPRRSQQQRDHDDENRDSFDSRESLDLELTPEELASSPDKDTQQQSRPLTNGGGGSSSSSNGGAPNKYNHHHHHDPGEPRIPHHLPDADEQKRQWLQCLLLEAGILFHSIFIGMALSVASGPAFVVFLVAIAFHQSFEGLALGSRIAAIHFPRASLKPWLMVLAYGTTTPIGQAIGLIVHEFYDPMSQTGLLMVGIMNAISSGLLLFAGLVQLLAEDFLTEKSYRTLKGKRRVHAFAAVVGGATLMALVGAVA